MTQKQMTPADKAIQLLQNFGCTTMFSKDNNGYTLSLKTAKKCALIMAEDFNRHKRLSVIVMWYGDLLREGG